MSLPIYRLRRVLAATAVLITVAVVCMYFYARSRATNVLKTVPNKIGFDVKQTAHGFQFSKSDGKRTLFTVDASDVKEFKLNGNAELHNVNIILYGRDSTRYDQIYGDEFAYNQKTGDVTAMGDVSIDLVENPAGLGSPDQSTPKELKNPIHLKTRDLIFNKNTGNASTDARVEFRSPQASGWAVGVQYSGKNNELTLSSQIHLALTGPDAAVIEATHGVITNDPRQIVLDHPHLDREGGNLRAEEAIFYLGTDNHIQRVVAQGDVSTATRTSRAAASKSRTAATGSHPPLQDASQMHAHADRAEFLFLPGEDLLRSAVLSGQVHFEQTGAHTMQGQAAKVIVDFAAQNQVRKVHALENVHLIQGSGSQPASSANKPPSEQDFDLLASAVDFTIDRGHVLRQAVTSGLAEIRINQESDVHSHAPPQQTVVTAGRFVADFLRADGHTRLAGVHGAPDARIVNATAGQPDRVSTSDSIDATFLPQGGIESLTQRGHVTYSDGQGADKRMQAWANVGVYTPADQILILSGSPRVATGGMATTAKTVRIHRDTGDAEAEGDVKSTFSEVKENPDGALLASSSPIHVTAQSMTAHRSPALALYKGNARLWQDANVLEAPSLQFDRDRRSVVASGTPMHPVQTILVQPEKSVGPGSTASGKATKPPTNPVIITAARVTYADSERRVHYEGGVHAKATEFTASSNTADAYLQPRSQTVSIQSAGSSPGQLDRMVARGRVAIQQPTRRAEGEELVYTTVDDKFVLTGGPPSIFDAEHGKITGVSLTFFRRDDRVLVEGEASTPVVTQTRVGR